MPAALDDGVVQAEAAIAVLLDEVRRTMALVTTMPVSIRIPIRPGSDSDVLVTTSAMMAPVAANGIETSRTSGFSRERKVATMIR